MQRDYLIRVETESMPDFKRLNGLMIGFVIKGEAHIYDENNMTQCNSGDIFIINHRDLYRFQLQQDGIICYIQFQMKYLADKFDDAHCLYFSLNRCDHNQEYTSTEKYNGKTGFNTHST